MEGGIGEWREGVTHLKLRRAKAALDSRSKHGVGHSDRQHRRLEHLCAELVLDGVQPAHRVRRVAVPLCQVVQLARLDRVEVLQPVSCVISVRPPSNNNIEQRNNG